MTFPIHALDLNRRCWGLTVIPSLGQLKFIWWICTFVHLTITVIFYWCSCDVLSIYKCAVWHKTIWIRWWMETVAFWNFINSTRTHLNTQTHRLLLCVLMRKQWRVLFTQLYCCRSLFWPFLELFSGSPSGKQLTLRAWRGTAAVCLHVEPV